MKSLNTAGATYTYDPTGMRVRKQVGSNITEYIYFGSEVIAERDQAGVWTDYVFANGRRLAKAPASTDTDATQYYHGDHLASSRIVTNSSGVPIWEATYRPYGEEHNPQSTTNHYKFTGKERDGESTLDFFVARYYSSAYARFTSPDEFVGGPVNAFSTGDPLPQRALPYAALNNPQSLNKYAYAFNNPIVYIDPNGHGPCDTFRSVCEFLNIIEVKIRGGLSVGTGGQAGPVKLKYEKTLVAIEGKAGLGGGNREAKVVTEIAATGKVGPLGGSLTAGAELSTATGPKAGVEAEGKAGPLGGKAGADTDKGLYADPSVGVGADQDSRLGLEVTLGVGVGIALNLSQAVRVFNQTRESVESLVSLVAEKANSMGIVTVPQAPNYSPTRPEPPRN